MSNGNDEFDLDDLDSEAEQWAEQALKPPATVGGRAAGGWAVFDIETGSLPWSEIEQFYEAPAALLPFDESSVKYGNTKDAAKRAVILEEKRAAHAKLLADEAAAREAHKQKFIDDAALSAMTGQVLAIGLSTMTYSFCLYDNGKGESALLQRFWSTVDTWLAAKFTIIGHNSTGFDWPFLIRRSWRLGVDVPRDLMQGRYLNPLCRDTQSVWFFNQPKLVKLDLLARFFGVGGKPDNCTGATFAKLWSGTAEEKKIAVEYLKNDIAMTRAVAKCLGMI